MGVMDGRRFKFEALEDGDGYHVSAITTGYVAPLPLHVTLGEVRRERRSTDSKVAGTRLRRQGKGAPCWRAVVPAEQADRSGRVPARHLQGTGLSIRGWRLEEWRGETWERREDAALALADWFDYPEKREAAA